MANLYLLGRTSRLNERLTSLAIRSAKTVTRDYWCATVGMASKVSPTNGALVRNGVDRVANSAAIACLSAFTKHSAQCSVLIVSMIRQTMTDMQ